VIERVPNSESVSRGEPTGNVLKASDLIGMTVERGNRQSVGKVEDIVVGLETGRVVAVVVALHENSTLRAVPPAVLHCDLLQRIAHLKIPPAKLKSAPVLERPTWQEDFKPDKLAALYRHFDVEPSFAVPGKDTSPSPPPLGVLEMATRLDGAPVRNTKGDQIGQVHNCMVDLSTGRIPVVILATGDYIGNKGALSPVPAQAMIYDKARAGLVLDTDRNSLTKMPHFKSKAWPDMNKGTFLADVYVAYGVKPQEATTPAPEPEKKGR
jgi:sporulation protein YlmC with PRC-barrel domain